VEYFKPTPEFHKTPSFRFAEAFDVIGCEAAAVQNGVGLAEGNGFNRIEITSAGAGDLLDWMICGRVTRKAGKVGLGYLLKHQGIHKAKATVANLPDGQIWYGSGGCGGMARYGSAARSCAGRRVSAPSDQ
jgi:dimethylglycine dehydrogenase